MSWLQTCIDYVLVGREKNSRYEGKTLEQKEEMAREEINDMDHCELMDLIEESYRAETEL